MRNLHRTDMITIQPNVEFRKATEADFGPSDQFPVKSPVANPTEKFAEVLSRSIDKTNEYQTQADTAIKELVAGKTKNIHETMLAIERAEVSLKLMMQVRNKVLDAYKEIMRMQV